MPCVKFNPVFSSRNLSGACQLSCLSRMRLQLAQMGSSPLSNCTSANEAWSCRNSVFRSWNDSTFGPGDPRTGNYTPDCDLTNLALNGECGPILNNNFSNSNPNATRYAPDTISGWGNRDYIWDFSAEVNHAINRQITVNAGYYRNWGKNFNITDNQALTPADYTTYCITAPVDSRLPKSVWSANGW